MPSAALATTGSVLTATEYNYLPRGTLADSGLLSTTFATSSTHTTLQTITGMSISVAYGASRLLKVSASLHIYPNGGLQGVTLAFLRGSTQFWTFTYDQNMLNASASTPVTPIAFITSPSPGATETFTCKIAAASANTAVTAYAAAASQQYMRFWVEDCGSA